LAGWLFGWWGGCLANGAANTNTQKKVSNDYNEIYEIENLESSECRVNVQPRGQRLSQNESFENS